MKYILLFGLLVLILYSSCSSCEEEGPMIVETRSPSANSFAKALYWAGDEIQLITPREDTIQLLSKQGIRRDEFVDGQLSFCPGGTPHQIVDGIEHVSQHHTFNDTSDFNVKFSLNESIEIGEEESISWDEREVTIVFDSNGVERTYRFSEFLETQTSIEDSIKVRLTPNFVSDTMLNGKSFQEVFWFEKETIAQTSYFLFYNQENGIIGLRDERDEFYSFERK